jgi:catechol 2,3-dioxygenase-like lactoylglutathione lyase family enzyme
MIQRISHVSLFVLDQNRALDFYTKKLGMTVNTDQRMGDFRWLTVSPAGQHDIEIVLMKVAATPMMDEETADTVRTLVQKGALGAGVLETDDIQRTYEELRAKGVEFMGEPQERPYGIEALLKDDSGNWFSVVQRRG